MGHLTYDDRLIIQQKLYEGKNFHEIAGCIGKNRTTVSREVLRHRIFKPSLFKGNTCKNRKICDIPNTCTQLCYLKTNCKSCNKCNINCNQYVEDKCLKVEKPPYVCNRCSKQCRYGRWIYSAKQAQLKYESELIESRSGISLPNESLDFLNEKIIPLVKKGVAISVACNKYADEMPVSAKTVYSYIDKGYLDASNLDLRLKVRRPLRKKTGPILRVDKKCHVGRSYSQYLKYLDSHPETTTCQMDTVIGRKGGKCVLSLLFTNCDLQLYFLRKSNTAATVTKVFAELRDCLSEDFTKLFNVMLTDRGTEFTDPTKIEADCETGEVQCKVFYCDPMQSNQKSCCERNHELFRYIFPKGTSLDKYTQEDISLAASHINSYPREKWNYKTPCEIFEEIYGTEILKKLGIKKIKLEDVLLKPTLLQK